MNRPTETEVLTSAAEDGFIDELQAMRGRGCGSEELQQRARALSGRYDVVARQAWSVHRDYSRRSGRPAIERDEFERRHLESWASFLLHASQSATCSTDVPDELRGRRLLYLLWHTPAYPRWLAAAARWDGLVLIARRARWMASVAGSSSLYEFRAHGFSSTLPRALARGKITCAMMDYCYPETRFAHSTFLGVAVRTPVGLVTLAQRFGYEVRVATPEARGLVILDSFLARGIDSSEIVRRVDRAIGTAISADPPRWLMWSMAHRRWLERSPSVCEDAPAMSEHDSSSAERSR